MRRAVLLAGWLASSLMLPLAGRALAEGGEALPPAPVGPAPAAPAPPPLLDPDTPPAALPDLIPAPAIATAAPIPAAAAGNCAQRDNEGRFLGWMDYEHCVLSSRTLASARWFDDLFGDWHEDQATLLLKAISETTLTEADGASANFRLRASTALPNASKRLRLVVEDDSLQDEQIGDQDVLSQLDRARNRMSAALRWVSLREVGFQSDFDVGVRGVNPPDLFARARVRNSWGLSRDLALRFGQMLRYGSDSKGVALTQLDLEYAVSDTALARFSNAYEYDQRAPDNGLSWGHGVSMAHVLGDSSALSYGFSVNGVTRPDWRNDNYGPWFLYRRSFLRSWLFYELEPRLTWYRDRDWDSVLSLTMRLEIQLGRQ